MYCFDLYERLLNKSKGIYVWTSLGTRIMENRRFWDLGFWILDFWILVFGFWIFGFWILDFGFWILNFEFWIEDLGLKIYD